MPNKFTELSRQLPQGSSSNSTSPSSKPPKANATTTAPLTLPGFSPLKFSESRPASSKNTKTVSLVINEAPTSPSTERKSKGSSKSKESEAVTATKPAKSTKDVSKSPATNAVPTDTATSQPKSIQALKTATTERRHSLTIVEQVDLLLVQVQVDNRYFARQLSQALHPASSLALHQQQPVTSSRPVSASPPTSPTKLPLSASHHHHQVHAQYQKFPSYLLIQLPQHTAPPCAACAFLAPFYNTAAVVTLKPRVTLSVYSPSGAQSAPNSPWRFRKDGPQSLMPRMQSEVGSTSQSPGTTPSSSAEESGQTSATPTSMSASMTSHLDETSSSQHAISPRRLTLHVASSARAAGDLHENHGDDQASTSRSTTPTPGSPARRMTKIAPSTAHTETPQPDSGRRLTVSANMFPAHPVSPEPARKHSISPLPTGREDTLSPGSARRPTQSSPVVTTATLKGSELPAISEPATLEPSTRRLTRIATNLHSSSAPLITSPPAEKSAVMLHTGSDVPTIVCQLFDVQGPPGILQYERESRIPIRIVPAPRAMAKPKTRMDSYAPHVGVSEIMTDEEIMNRLARFERAVVAATRTEPPVKRISSQSNPEEDEEEPSTERDIQPISLVKVAEDFRTWTPLSTHSTFRFSKVEEESVSDTKSEIEEKETLSEWATTQLYQSWCAARFPGEPVDVDIAESRGQLQTECYDSGTAFLILCRHSGSTFYPSGRVCTSFSYTKSGMYAWARDDSDSGKLLASISPLSGGTFFSPDGRIIALFSPLYFIAFDDEGNIKREVKMGDIMPAQVVTLSPCIQVSIRSIRDVNIIIHVDNKTYRVNLAATSRKQLYRATNDVLLHDGYTSEMENLKEKSKVIMSQMRTIIDMTSQFDKIAKDEDGFESAASPSKVTSRVRSALSRPTTASAKIPAATTTATLSPSEVFSELMVNMQHLRVRSALPRVAEPSEIVPQEKELARPKISRPVTAAVTRKPASAGSRIVCPVKLMQRRVSSAPVNVDAQSKHQCGCIISGRQFPDIDDRCLEEVLKSVPKNQMLLIYCPLTASDAGDDVERAMNELATSQINAGEKHPCTFWTHHQFRLLRYTGFRKLSLSSPILQERFSVAADMFVVMANNKLLYGSTTLSKRKCTKSDLMDIVRHCTAALLKEQYLPQGFKFV